ncbi:hypothetical protein LPJ61_004567 [Coemansia biformis]|uniref:Peroxisomal membrane protein PEX16 n=1 Tax=Coemansia biformis TaxID=1286918 RepID=A0A9W7YA01_9FUNG|nr:hypothetical protein LPJ61_004567 [Coemansia biformis]
MLQQYANFVVNNASQVSSIENALRMLTYILPGRFADAELASEAIYTLLSFVGVYHDGLLAKAAKTGLLVDKQGQPVKVDVTPFNRYHGRLARRSDLYRAASMLLGGLQFGEKLVEMIAAKRLGEKQRWRVVAWTEIAKIVLRLALLQLSGRRMVTGSVVPERLVDPATLGAAGRIAGAAGAFGEAADGTGAPWKGGRSGLEFRSVRGILEKAEGSANLDRYIAGAARDPEKVAPALSLVRRFGPLGLAGELLFILRPLVYVMGMRKLGTKDWRPWALSLLIELASRQMIRSDLHAKGTAMPEHTVERDELARRKWLFLYYLLRSPFFDRFTESRLTRIADWCNNKPLLSLLGSLIQDYQPLWQQYYFYTAGS